MATSPSIAGTIRKMCAVAVAVGAVSLGATDAGASTGRQLPFKASVAGSAVLTSPSTGTFTGHGVASYLGAISDHGGVVAHFDEPSATCPSGFASTNTETFTALLGSLSIESDDVTCPVGPAQPTQFNGTGHWHVVGGTGLYRHTVGSGSYTGFADFGHKYTFTFVGTIS